MLSTSLCWADPGGEDGEEAGGGDGEEGGEGTERKKQKKVSPAKCAVLLLRGPFRW